MSLLWGGLERKKPVNNLPPLAASPVMKGWKERINLVCACSDTKKIARLVGGYLKFSLWFIYFWKLFIWKVKSGQVTDLRVGGPSWQNLGRKLHLVAMCESRQLVRPRLQLYSGVQGCTGLYTCCTVGQSQLLLQSGQAAEGSGRRERTDWPPGPSQQAASEGENTGDSQSLTTLIWSQLSKY